MLLLCRTSLVEMQWSSGWEGHFNHVHHFQSKSWFTWRHLSKDSCNVKVESRRWDSAAFNIFPHSFLGALQQHFAQWYLPLCCSFLTVVDAGEPLLFFVQALVDQEFLLPIPFPAWTLGSSAYLTPVWEIINTMEYVILAGWLRISKRCGVLVNMSGALWAFCNVWVLIWTWHETHNTEHLTSKGWVCKCECQFFSLVHYRSSIMPFLMFTFNQILIYFALKTTHSGSYPFTCAATKAI